MLNLNYRLSTLAIIILLASISGCSSLNTNNIMPESLKDWRYAKWNPWVEPKPQAKVAPAKPVKVNLLSINQISSFRGIVPCSDCEHIELILTLRPDQVFFLRKEFKRLPKRKRGRQQEIGGWKLSDDGKQLILKRGDNSVQTLAINSSQQLELLNAEGKRISATGNYTLKRMESALALIDSTRMQGMYYENSGRGYWLECQSGVTWPVARAGDYVKLSQQYNALNKPTASSTVFAKFTAHFATRPDDGADESELLVVDDFIALENRFHCP